jgi:hypothetical protein
MRLTMRQRLRIVQHSLPVRFAHHPLCARHQHETWRVGAVHLCKGCVSLGLGLFTGTAAVIAWSGAWITPVAAALLPLVLLLSWPRLYARLDRSLRNIMRVALGWLIALGSFAIVNSFTYLWPLLPVFIALWLLYKRNRQQVLANRCTGCPELGRGICSGYTVHARAQRAIEAELESQLLLSGVSGPPSMR